MSIYYFLHENKNTQRIKCNTLIIASDKITILHFYDLNYARTLKNISFI